MTIALAVLVLVLVLSNLWSAMALSLIRSQVRTMNQLLEIWAIRWEDPETRDMLLRVLAPQQSTCDVVCTLLHLWPVKRALGLRARAS